MERINDPIIGWYFKQLRRRLSIGERGRYERFIERYIEEICKDEHSKEQFAKQYQEYRKIFYGESS